MNCIRETPLFSKKYSVVLEMTVNLEFLANCVFFQIIFYMHVVNSLKSRDCQSIVCKLQHFLTLIDMRGGGDTFISLSFLYQILSGEYLSKIPNVFLGEN